jgi:hypothetical protein
VATDRPEPGLVRLLIERGARQHAHGMRVSRRRSKSRSRLKPFCHQAPRSCSRQ